MNILTADIGSTYTKLTAIDTAKREIVATSAAFTTIGTNVKEGFMAAYNKLGQHAGEFLYDELLCCSSAAGGDLKWFHWGGWFPNLPLRRQNLPQPVREQKWSNICF